MTIRLGLLGAARITRAAILDPAARVEGVDVVAIAARDPTRAQAFAREHGIPRVEATYAQLVEGDVDAVYNALPASFHAEWSERALSAGEPASS